MDGDKLEFAPHDEIDEAEDQSRLNCLAACIANQQAAGFKSYLDTREVHCANCGASGFNTGWGYWQFTCGLEVLSDGEESGACSNQPRGLSAAEGLQPEGVNPNGSE